MAAVIPGQSQEPRPGTAKLPKNPDISSTLPDLRRSADAQRTRTELNFIMRRYPPGLGAVLSLDPSLLSNQTFLDPYPDLAGFLSAHPEVIRDPSFYFGGPNYPSRFRATPAEQNWNEAARGLVILGGFAIALGLAVWLIRTIVDQRRWIRLNQIQTEAHSRILDRLSSNEELLAYIQSPAGSKFLESSPIRLDSGPRTYGSPMNRIIWTIQAGIVLAAGGGGFLFVASNSPEDVTGLLHGIGILAIAVGAGFVISAIISFGISQRFGLIEAPSGKHE